MDKLTPTRALQLFQLLRQSSMILLGVLLVKGGMDGAEIAVLESFLLFANILAFFWLSGWINSLLALYPDRSLDQAALLSNSFWILSMFGGATALVSFIILYFLGADVVGGKILLILVPAYLFFSNSAHLLEYRLYLQNKFGKLILLGLLWMLAVLAIGYTGLQHGSIEWVVAGLCLLALIRWLACLFSLRSSLSLKIDRRILKVQFDLAVPTILSLLLAGSAEYIDGLLVKFNFTAEEFALYRYGAREFPLILILSNALAVGLVPHLASELNNGLELMKKESKGLILMLLPLSLVLMGFSEPIFQLLFDSSFAAAHIYFDCYLLLLIPRMLFPQSILLALRKNKLLLWGSLSEIILNIALSLILMQFYGMMGIAMATFLAFMIEKTILSYFTRKAVGSWSDMGWRPVWLASWALALFFVFKHMDRLI